MPESLVQLLLTGLRGLTDIADALPAETRVESRCSGGTFTADLVDADGSLTVSVGDTVEVSFSSGCFVNELETTANAGRIALEITESIIERNGDYLVGGRFSTPDALALDLSDGGGAGGPTGLVFADFSFRALRQADEESETLWIDAQTDDTLLLSITDGAERFRETTSEFSITRRLVPTGSGTDYEVEFAFEQRSELVAGSLSCATTTPLTGTLGDGAVAGEARCGGAGASAVRVAGTFDGARPVPALTFDPEGDGGFRQIPLPEGVNGFWFDVVESTLFERPAATIARRFGDAGFAPLTFTSRDAAVTDFVHDPATDRLYVSNAAGIIVIDGATLTTIDSVAVAGQPSALALSDDGSTLWFGLSGRQEIQSLDTGTLTLGAAFGLGTPPASVFPSERFVRELRVAPGTTDTVVATMLNGEEIVAYAAGVELPNAIADEFVDRLAFRSDTEIVATNDSNTGFDAYEVTFDAATGVTLDQAFPNLSSGFDSPISVDGEVVLAASGVLFDERSGDRLGRLPLPPGTTGVRYATFDPARERAYAFDSFNDALLVYGTAPLRLLSIYALELADFGGARILATPNAVIVHDESRILRIAADALAPNLPSACTRTDLSGEIVAGTYVQLECGFSDVVPDPTRGVLYGGVRGSSGGAGNALATISAATLTVDTLLPVGGDPIALSLSADTSRMYVARGRSSRVAAVDVGAGTVSSEFSLGYRSAGDGRLLDPRMAGQVAASPLDSRDALVSTGNTREAAFFRNGVADARITGTNSNFSDLVLRSDGALAIGFDFGLSDVLAIDSDGVSVASGRETFLNGRIAARGDLIHSTTGQVFDIRSLTGLADCPLPDPLVNAIAVAPDIDGNAVHYIGSVGGVLQVASCDLADGSSLGTLPVPILGEETGSVTSLVSIGNGLLAVALENRLIFVDAPGS